MMSFATLATLTLVAICYVDAQSIASGIVMELMLETIQSLDSSVTGAGSASSATGQGTLWPITRAKGLAGPTNDVVFTPDSCVNMNTLGTVLVAYATLLLLEKTSFATSLDTPIATAYAPGGLALTSNSVLITYQQLLTQTSTINDNEFGNYVVTTGTVGSLASFVESYFVTPNGAQNTAVFNTGVTPGTPEAYQFARANTALMAYILEQVIAAKLPSAGTLRDFIVDNILVPFGMSQTFWLNTDGSVPGVTPWPVFSGTWSSFDPNSASVYAPYFSGCIADATLSFQLHPAWIADYMGFTTLSDINSLASSLFMSTSTQYYLSQMVEETFLSSTYATSVLQQGQSGTGLGLMFFDGDVICATAMSTSVVSTCPVSNQSTIAGFIAARRSTLIGFLCAQDSSGYMCTSGAFVVSSLSASSFNDMFDVAGAAFQEQLGTVTVAATPPPSAGGSSSNNQAFGVEVFFGVYLTVLFVVFGTMVMQYFLIPPSLSQVTNTNAFTVGSGPGSKISPTRSVALDFSSPAAA